MPPSSSTERLVNLPTLTSVWLLPMVVEAIHRYMKQPDFAILCRLSRMFYEKGNEVLYSSIILLATDLDDNTAMTSICHTLNEHPRLASFVRSLRCVSKHPKKHLSNPDQVSANLELLPHLLSKLHRLEAFDIVDCFPQSLETIKKIRLPSSLKHFGLERKVPEWPNALVAIYNCNIAMLRTALTLPQLESLTAILQEDGSGISPTLPTNSQVTRLGLIDIVLAIDTFRAVLAALPCVTDLNLEFVRYIESWNESIPLHINCHELQAALHPYALTMEKLRIVAKFGSFDGGDTGDGGGAEAPWGTISTLDFRSYSALKHLELAPEMLLGWDMESSPELSACLPQQLRSLHLRYDYGAWYDSVWTFATICEKLDGYIIASHQSLQRITIDCFAFLLPTISRPLNSIAAKCEAAGIRFHLNSI